MLAKSTIAGQEGVITYLANAAALQQFEQTALAYVLMSEAGRSMGAPGLAAAAESLLEGKFEVLIAVCLALTDSCHVALYLPSVLMQSTPHHTTPLLRLLWCHHSILPRRIDLTCHGSDCTLQALNLLAYEMHTDYHVNLVSMVIQRFPCHCR